MPADTIHGWFFRTSADHAERTAIMHKKGGRYQGISFSELAGMVRTLQGGLSTLGVARDQRVGILSGNCPQWVVSDLALLAAGAVVVPLCTDFSPAQIRHVIEDAELKLIFVEDMEKMALLDEMHHEQSSPFQVVLYNPGAGEIPSTVLAFDDLLQQGETAEMDTSPVGASGDDVATVVYTSGTSGKPKGVMLSHGNIAANARALIKRFKLTANDVFLSFLPLSHMFERTCGYYAILLPGGCIAYAENLQTITEDIKTVRPTVINTVPRVLEKIYDAIARRVMAGPVITRAMTLSAIRDLNTYARLQSRGEPLPLSLKLKCRFFRMTVVKRFRKVGGRRLRIIVSGGAPLDQKIQKTLALFAYHIIEGYGLTEASPVVSCGGTRELVPGTVGRPLDGVEVEIGDRSEILVRGPGVMKGYLKRPLETARAIDEQGWLHTGDQGEWDSRGNLVICGRIKELIVTSYGKNIAPARIEETIGHSPYIEQIMVHGEREKCLVALVVPDRERIERWAEEQGITCPAYGELLCTAGVIDLIGREIETASGDLAPYEQVRGFALAAEPFTVAGELLTPTLKLRREAIAGHYEGAIRLIYTDLEKRNAL